jgi:hypothetical protein
VGGYAEPVASPTHIFALLQRASENRAVAYTQCNERSSRSHSVFQLKIHGRNESTGESATGLLNLVDLAGSERLSQSGSTGDVTHPLFLSIQPFNQSINQSNKQTNKGN